MTPSLLEPPLMSRLRRHDRILIAGAGGGFDVYAGLPLYVALRAAGRDVFLANLTFTYLGETDARYLAPHLALATARDDRRRPLLPRAPAGRVAARRRLSAVDLRVREGRRPAAARRLRAPGAGAAPRRHRAGRWRHGHPDARGRGRSRHARRGHDQPGGGREAGRASRPSSSASGSASTRTTASATRTCWRTSPRSSATAATSVRSR